MCSVNTHRDLAHCTHGQGYSGIFKLDSLGGFAHEITHRKAALLQTPITYASITAGLHTTQTQSHQYKTHLDKYAYTNSMVTKKFLLPTPVNMSHKQNIDTGSRCLLSTPNTHHNTYLNIHRTQNKPIHNIKRKVQDKHILPKETFQAAKTFSGVLRCISHQHKIQEQIQGQWHTGFRNKIRTVQGFITPAYSTQALRQTIKDITSTWAKTIMSSLQNHYQDTLKHFTAELVNHTHLPEKDIKLAIDKATSWFKTQHKDINPDIYQSFTSHIYKHLKIHKSTRKCTTSFKDLAYIKLPSQNFNQTTINKNGHYILPGKTNNKSHITLQHHFFSESEADTLFTQLNSLPFEKLYHKHNNIAQPRDTFARGPVYTYSDITIKENNQWPEVLKKLCDIAENSSGHTFNSVLVNRYNDNKQSIGMHADNEPELGDNPYIFSLSFGASRTFSMQGNNQEISIPLHSGTALSMYGSTQTYWKHGIHKSKSTCKARINVTFRFIHQDKSNGTTGSSPSTKSISNSSKQSITASIHSHNISPKPTTSSLAAQISPEPPLPRPKRQRRQNCAYSSQPTPLTFITTRETSPKPHRSSSKKRIHESDSDNTNTSIDQVSFITAHNTSLLDKTDPEPIPTNTEQVQNNKVNIHNSTREKYQDWELPLIKTNILLLGDSNLSRIKVCPSNMTIHAFPGAKIEHITNILRTYKHDPSKVQHIILQPGINNKSSNSPDYVSKLTTMLINQAKRTFNTAEVHGLQVNHSTQLPLQEEKILQIINNCYNKHTKAIPCLPPLLFRTETDNIHWTSSTAEHILTHITSHLN